MILILETLCRGKSQIQENHSPKDLHYTIIYGKILAVGKTRNRGLGGYEVNEVLKYNEGKKSLNLFSLEEGQKSIAQQSHL
jgi:type I restriction enzyme M protein